jgi:hypothetical protein
MTKEKQDYTRWGAVLVTLVLTLVGFAVQCGIMVQTMKGLQSSVGDLIGEVRSCRADYSSLNTRVAVIESRSRVGKD